MQFEIIPYMRRAIAAARAQSTPYGAVIVAPGAEKHLVVANEVKASGDPTAHAEVTAIRRAAEAGLPLRGATLVTTCEPCPMCAMASVWAGIETIYFGASIDDAARYGNQVKIYSREIAAAAWYPLRIEGGILAEECAALFEVVRG